MTSLRYTIGALVLAVCLACGTGSSHSAPSAAAAGPEDVALDALIASAAGGAVWGDTPASTSVAGWIRDDLHRRDTPTDRGVAVQVVPGEPPHLLVAVRLGRGESTSLELVDEALAVVDAYAPYPSDIAVVLTDEQGRCGANGARIGSAWPVHTGRPRAEWLALFTPSHGGAPATTPLVSGVYGDVLGALNRAAAPDTASDDEDDHVGIPLRRRHTSLECTAPDQCSLGVVLVGGALPHTGTVHVRDFGALRDADGEPTEAFRDAVERAVVAWATSGHD